jgi:hypothetical protein
MSDTFPDKKSQVYTKNITLRIEPELYEAFETLKRLTKKDVPEAQRIVLRELAKRLNEEIAS